MQAISKMFNVSLTNKTHIIKYSNLNITIKYKSLTSRLPFNVTIKDVSITIENTENVNSRKNNNVIIFLKDMFLKYFIFKYLHLRCYNVKIFYDKLKIEINELKFKNKEIEIENINIFELKEKYEKISNNIFVNVLLNDDLDINEINLGDIDIKQIGISNLFSILNLLKSNFSKDTNSENSKKTNNFVVLLNSLNINFSDFILDLKLKNLLISKKLLSLNTLNINFEEFELDTKLFEINLLTLVSWFNFGDDYFEDLFALKSDLNKNYEFIHEKLKKKLSFDSIILKKKLAFNLLPIQNEIILIEGNKQSLNLNLNEDFVGFILKIIFFSLNFFEDEDKNVENNIYSKKKDLNILSITLYFIFKIAINKTFIINYKNISTNVSEIITNSGIKNNLLVSINKFNIKIFDLVCIKYDTILEKNFIEVYLKEQEYGLLRNVLRCLMYSIKKLNDLNTIGTTKDLSIIDNTEDIINTISTNKELQNINANLAKSNIILDVFLPNYYLKLNIPQLFVYNSDKKEIINFNTKSNIIIGKLKNKDLKKIYKIINLDEFKELLDIFEETENVTQNEKNYDENSKKLLKINLKLKNIGNLKISQLSPKNSNIFSIKLNDSILILNKSVKLNKVKISELEIINFKRIYNFYLRLIYFFESRKFIDNLKENLKIKDDKNILSKIKKGIQIFNEIKSEDCKIKIFESKVRIVEEKFNYFIESKGRVNLKINLNEFVDFQAFVFIDNLFLERLFELNTKINTNNKIDTDLTEKDNVINTDITEKNNILFNEIYNLFQKINVAIKYEHKTPKNILNSNSDTKIYDSDNFLIHLNNKTKKFEKNKKVLNFLVERENITRNIYDPFIQKKELNAEDLFDLIFKRSLNLGKLDLFYCNSNNNKVLEVNSFEKNCNLVDLTNLYSKDKKIEIKENSGISAPNDIKLPYISHDNPSINYKNNDFLAKFKKFQNFKLSPFLFYNSLNLHLNNSILKNSDNNIITTKDSILITKNLIIHNETIFDIVIYFYLNDDFTIENKSDFYKNKNITFKDIYLPLELKSHIFVTEKILYKSNKYLKREVLQNKRNFSIDYTAKDTNETIKRLYIGQSCVKINKNIKNEVIRYLKDKIYFRTTIVIESEITKIYIKPVYMITNLIKLDFINNFVNPMKNTKYLKDDKYISPINSAKFVNKNILKSLNQNKTLEFYNSRGLKISFLKEFEFKMENIKNENLYYDKKEKQIFEFKENKNEIIVFLKSVIVNFTALDLDSEINLVKHNNSNKDKIFIDNIDVTNNLYTPFYKNSTFQIYYKNTKKEIKVNRKFKEIEDLKIYRVLKGDTFYFLILKSETIDNMTNPDNFNKLKDFINYTFNFDGENEFMRNILNLKNNLFEINIKTLNIALFDYNYNFCDFKCSKIENFEENSNNSKNKYIFKNCKKILKKSSYVINTNKCKSYYKPPTIITHTIILLQNITTSLFDKKIFVKYDYLQLDNPKLSSVVLKSFRSSLLIHNLNNSPKIILNLNKAILFTSGISNSDSPLNLNLNIQVNSFDLQILKKSLKFKLSLPEITVYDSNVNLLTDIMENRIYKEIGKKFLIGLPENVINTSERTVVKLFGYFNKGLNDINTMFLKSGNKHNKSNVNVEEDEKFYFLERWNNIFKKLKEHINIIDSSIDIDNFKNKADDFPKTVSQNYLSCIKILYQLTRIKEIETSTFKDYITHKTLENFNSLNNNILVKHKFLLNNKNLDLKSSDSEIFEYFFDLKSENLRIKPTSLFLSHNFKSNDIKNEEFSEILPIINFCTYKGLNLKTWDLEFPLSLYNEPSTNINGIDKFEDPILVCLDKKRFIFNNFVTSGKFNIKKKMLLDAILCYDFVYIMSNGIIRLKEFKFKAKSSKYMEFEVFNESVVVEYYFGRELLILIQKFSSF